MKKKKLGYSDQNNIFKHHSTNTFISRVKILKFSALQSTYLVTFHIKEISSKFKVITLNQCNNFFVLAITNNTFDRTLIPFNNSMGKFCA